MNKEIAEVAIKLLNRVDIKGHEERNAMNVVCDSLVQIIKDANEAAPEEKVEPKGK